MWVAEELPGVYHLLTLGESESCSVVSDSLQSHGPYSPWNSQGQNTGMGNDSLLQGSSQPRDQTQVSHTAGGFFTNWATREAHRYVFLLTFSSMMVYPRILTIVPWRQDFSGEPPELLRGIWRESSVPDNSVMGTCSLHGPSGLRNKVHFRGRLQSSVFLCYVWNLMYVWKQGSSNLLTSFLIPKK